MTINASTFEAFQADALAAGFDEGLESRWAPDTVLDTHSRTFGVEAVITQGEMWFSCEGRSRHLIPDRVFTLEPQVVHDERYGAYCVTYRVARHNPR